MSPDGAGAERARLRQRLRATALGALDAALAAVDSGDAVARAMPDALARAPLAGAREIEVIAWGKAAVPMARAAVDALGSRAVPGLVVTKAGHDEGLTRVGPLPVRLAGHPLPDASSQEAARELTRLAGRPERRDVPVLVLGSGGGSALLACPVEGVTVEDLADVTSQLLRGGASIHELNIVRRHLSSVHGGGFARALRRRRSLSLLVSDVPGDAWRDIGSGPLAADASTFTDALAVLEARAPRAPSRVRAALEAGARGSLPETEKWEGLEQQHRHVLVASNAHAVEAASRRLAAEGWRVEALPEASGDAGAAGIELVAASLRRAFLRPAPGEPAVPGADDGGEAVRTPERGIALIAGGETTAVVPEGAPGGRNQHVAAAAASALDLAAGRGWLAGVEVVIAALATDGEDGGAESSGGLADAGTWSRARTAGLDPDSKLAAMQAQDILRAAGDLLPGRPTRTNVMDLHLALIAHADGEAPEARA